MGKNKSSISWLELKPVEVIFWLIVISTALFINISPKAISSTDLLFMVVFLTAFLIVIAGRIWVHVTDPIKRAILIISVTAVIAVSFFLLKQGAAAQLVFRYLPLMLSISMAILLIIEPRSLVVLLIIGCIFLLGEAFWSVSIGADKTLQLSPTFLRIFSLTLVTIFIYYLYRRQIRLKNQLSEFVANVSHELLTPLTSIKNANTLLAKKINSLEKEVTMSYEELLDIISSNIERQAKMINSLLDLSRPEKIKETENSL